MRKPQCTPFVAIQWFSPYGRWKHVQVPCRRWTCKWCGPLRRFHLQRSTLAAMEKFNLNWFVTLTLKFGVVVPEESPAYIQRCWNKFLILARRKYGKLAFIVFKEFQKNGMVHLHALVDRELGQIWTSNAWQAVGGGMIVDVRPVESPNAAKYLCKYVTKSAPMKLPKAYRRVSASRGIVLYPKLGEGQWKAFKYNYDRLARAMLPDRIGTITNFNGEETGFEASRPAIPHRPGKRTKPYDAASKRTAGGL